VISYSHVLEYLPSDRNLILSLHAPLPTGAACTDIIRYEKPDKPGWVKKIAGKLHIVNAPVPSAVKVEAIRTSLANPDLGKKIWSYYDFVTGKYSGSTKDDKVTGGQWKNLKKYRAELAKDKKKQEQPKMFGWWQTYTGERHTVSIRNMFLLLLLQTLLQTLRLPRLI
jgi:hypothetical protein